MTFRQPRVPASPACRSTLARLLLATLLLGEAAAGPPAPAAPAAGPDAWQAARAMGLGVNIGNTFDNTTTWETGWGNPPVSRDYIRALASYGFRTVRVPVAWDTYARDGWIAPDKLARVTQVVDWVLEAGMYCVINIHWDGGWIDAGDRHRYGSDYATLTPEAERKFRGYWQQIAGHFAGHGDRLVFEGLNEESNFEGTGSMAQAQATLGRVNQLFIDTVRASGGLNGQRLLVIAGYETDFGKTASGQFVVPKDTVPHRLMVSVHYYTPSTFAILDRDAAWGKVQETWGSAEDQAALDRLFDQMQAFCLHNDLPAFVGEFAASPRREPAARRRWLVAVARAALKRQMVPVLWDTGHDVSRRPPYRVDEVLRDTLAELLPLQP